MALEAVVFQQDPYSYGLKDFCTLLVGNDDIFQEEKPLSQIFDHKMVQTLKEYWDTSSPENNSCTGAHDGLLAGVVEAPAAGTPCRRKRRRTKSIKNKDEVENQRMTHIAVERNRRRQMNDYLAVLRSIMPASYVQRGDQASIIGGAINFVKELEQLLQTLEAQKRTTQQPSQYNINEYSSSLFSDFFVFPQYSTASPSTESMVEKQSAIADVEVTMVESHANLKILSKRHPKQLLKMVAGLHSLGLSILHLNVTTVQHMALYSFSVKVEDNCQLTSVNEIATAVYEMLGKILEENDFIS